METDKIKELEQLYKERKIGDSVFPKDGKGIINIYNGDRIVYELAGQTYHHTNQYVYRAIRQMSSDIIDKAKEIEIEHFKEVELAAKIEAANILSGETII